MNIKNIYSIVICILLTLPSMSNANEIRLEWRSTGTSDIFVGVDDIISLDVILNGVSNPSQYSVSVDFSGAMLELQSVTDFASDASFSSASVTSNAANSVLYDINGDGVVGLPELAGMRSVFFLPDTEYDLNNDGIVNFIDLALIASNYGAGATIQPSTTNVLALGNSGPFGDTVVGDKLLATLGFRVTGNTGGEVIPFFNQGLDGIFNAASEDISGSTTLTGATLNGGSQNVTEPTWLGILGIGLLIASFRRRKLSIGDK